MFRGVPSGGRPANESAVAVARKSRGREALEAGIKPTARSGNGGVINSSAERTTESSRRGGSARAAEETSVGQAAAPAHAGPRGHLLPAGPSADAGPRDSG